MAGVAGKSGGARPNSGGKRAGAGRKPKAAPAESANGSTVSPGGVEVRLEPQPRGGALKRSKAAPVPIEERDMLQLLKDVALGIVDASPTQVRAAIAAVQYTHTKKGDGGVKDQKQDAANAAQKGRFGAPPPPPRLVSGGGK